MRTMNPSAPLPSSDSVAYAPVEMIVTSMDDMLVDDDKSDQFVPFPPAGAAEVSHETSKDYHENQKKYEPLLNRSIAESNPTPHTEAAMKAAYASAIRTQSQHNKRRRSTRCPFAILRL